jgi:Tol biopolymer transport system component
LVKDPNKRLRDVSGIELLLEQAPPVVVETKVMEKASRWPWAVAAAALSAAAVTGFLYMRQPEAAKLEVMRFEMQAPDDAPFGQQMRISPDGRMIAFTATGGGDTRRRMWIRSLDSLKAKPLPGTEGMQDGMFWLPDSRMLVFQLGGKLRKIDVTGGPAQPICDFSSSVGGGFLTADNQIVFGTPATLGIQSCPAGGGLAKSVTAFKPGGQEQFHAFPSLLPDGKHFLFWRQAGANTGIYAGSLDKKPEEETGKRILPDTSGTFFVPGAEGGPGALLFAREGTLMAQGFDAARLELVGEAAPVGENLENQYSFSASKDGKLAYLDSGGNNIQLTWFDRQGKMLGMLGKPGPPYGGMRISPDGTRLAAARREAGAQTDIWVVDLAQGSETRLTSDPAADHTPVWSPDGKQIAFSSNREGTDNMYVRAADGAGTDELLLKTGERKAPLDWSRDGKFLLFRVLSAKSSDVWVLPMDVGQPGERKPAPYLHTNANESSARFSADGRFVAYDSDESGIQEVYVRPFDPASPEASGSGAGKVKISQNGGAGPHWGPGGKELLYYTPDRKVWSVDVTWTPEFRASTPKLLGQVAQGNGTTTPDVQRLLIGVPVGSQRRSATVVLNWQAALKK